MPNKHAGRFCRLALADVLLSNLSSLGSWYLTSVSGGKEGGLARQVSSSQRQAKGMSIAMLLAPGFTCRWANKFGPVTSMDVCAFFFLS